MFLAAASINAIACSAVASLRTLGVFEIRILWRLSIGTSLMLSILMINKRSTYVIITSRDASNDFEFWHRLYHFFGYLGFRETGLSTDYRKFFGSNVKLLKRLKKIVRHPSCKPGQNGLNFVVVQSWIRKVNVFMDQLKVLLHFVNEKLFKLFISFSKTHLTCEIPFDSWWTPHKIKGFMASGVPLIKIFDAICFTRENRLAVQVFYNPFWRSVNVCFINLLPIN